MRDVRRNYLVVGSFVLLMGAVLVVWLSVLAGRTDPEARGETCCPVWVRPVDAASPPDGDSEKQPPRGSRQSSVNSGSPIAGDGCHHRRAAK